mmetsp:Transcript_10834/g.34399  ORF Transcript_10834/g.34399 Transcript_10834/m.34399 type:complete len:490 (+) Transcript_10834:60-1529(+)
MVARGIVSGLLGASAACAGAGYLSIADSAGHLAPQSAEARHPTEAVHPWPTFRGPQTQQFGASDVVVPGNLSASLAWSWHHPQGRYHTVVAGGPVIDAGGNAYLTTSDGVRKFGGDGQVLWHFPQPNGWINNEISLLGDKVFGSNQIGDAFAVHADTGTAAWVKKLAASAGADAGYPAGCDGVFVVSAERGMTGGNLLVFGLDSATGVELWNLRPKRPVWNFAPLFPGDDTCLFMDFSGGMYRVGLHNGTLIWHTPSKGALESFSDGGAVLGPNGAVYSCSNPVGGYEGEKGILRALRIKDGTLLWEQLLPQPCNSYPAVGHLSQGQGLSVVVTPGSFMHEGLLHGSIMAFDAATGAPQWRFNTKPYTGFMNMARGDLEGFAMRAKYDHGHEICLPAHWSSANIDGQGFVYAARSDGFVYGVRGLAAHAASEPPTTAAALANLRPDFESTPGLEVRVFDGQGASLHGAFAFAPGRMAVATCDTLYMFKA